MLNALLNMQIGSLLATFSAPIHGCDLISLANCKALPFAAARFRSRSRFMAC